MKGGIYSDQRCCLCKKSFKDNGVDGLECPDHPDQRATKFKAKFGELCNRFNTYLQARRRLEAWRQEVDDGVFDLRVHKADSPLALDLVFEEFMKTKRSLVERGRIKESTYKVYRRRMYRLTDFFGPKTLITDITFKAISAWLHTDKGATKTIDSCYFLLKEMLTWAYNCGDLPEMPRLPEWECTDDDMALRKTINKDIQSRILAKVYENEWDKSPRTYIACRWLATYINMRPGELISVKEQDLDRKERVLIIRRHKSGKNIPKVVRLHQEDIDLLNRLPKGMPHMPLFRYDKSVRGIPPGTKFGDSVLYTAWKKACRQLGIEDVDLYGGTRHSSALALRKEFGLSPEEIKKATGHSTSRSFMRYFRLDPDDISDIHRKARPADPEKMTLTLEK